MSPKKSVKSLDNVKTELKQISKSKSVVIKKEPPKSVAVPIVEEPLTIFVCRRCHNNFSTTDDYKCHDCPAQEFYILPDNPVDGAYDEALPKKPSVVRRVKTQKSENTDDRVVKEKKQRKPYTKRKESEEPKGPIECPTCFKTFTRKYHLERHLTHTTCNPGTYEREEFSCEVCSKVFTRIDNLRMHLRAHLGERPRTRDFQCLYCEKSFYGSSLLNIHIRSHTKEKPYLCDWELCGKGFPSSGALTKHRRTHTGEKPYSCSICGNRFAAKETLNRHTRTHTGRKDHVCRICGKSFIQNTQLKAHMFHHTGENAYHCDLCGRQFNRKTRLREHIEYIHLNKKMPTCNMCSKAFMRREDLSRHIESHIGERNHSCSSCNKKFVTRAAARIHMRVHQIEDPAQCRYCNKNFLRMDCLVRHVRSKHREMLQQIIVEAETNRIISAQQKKIGDSEELQIIVYNEDSHVKELYEIIDIAETIDVKLKPEKVKNSPIKKKTIQQEPVVEEDEDCEPIFLNDDILKKRVQELLEIVIEESLLKELGFGKKPIDEVLCSVLEQCSRQPLTKKDGNEDETTRMRENTKQLFSLVLDDDHIKSLLNNYTVDEVITIVLKMSK